jgi:hypothetical protein
MSETLVLKSYSFPEVSYVNQIHLAHSAFLDVAENYQKRSNRNRYKILSANGPMTLSIPLKKGKNEQQNIKDVQIAYDENWTKSHLETIRSAYGKSAYFEHYFDAYVSHFQLKHKWLYDFNHDSLRLILNQLKIDTEIGEINELQSLPILNEIRAKSYPQVFEHKFGFVSELSCIDLIFNVGPEGVLYL